MPIKHSRKLYAQQSYYHIYNRGVEKRIIFLDSQDYSVYLSHLKTYLLPKNEEELQEQLANPAINYREKDHILRLLRLNNFANDITLLAYCLMPNHLHFLIKQNSSEAMDTFMNSLHTRYVMYFNRKYQRRGPLYESVYKAVLVETEEQLVYLSSYIHRNPAPRAYLASKGLALRDRLLKQPSSYPEYLGKRKTEWIHPEIILSFFSRRSPLLSYEAFVEEPQDYEPIQNLKID